MSGPNENDPVRYLAVRSHLKETFRARFHGDEYVWEPEEELRMSEAAATHIFGYGLSDKTAAFQRTGWLNSKRREMKDAFKILARFDFRPVQQIFELATVRKASGSDRPLADAGQLEEEQESGIPGSSVQAQSAAG